jgi:hypothetical protein
MVDIESVDVSAVLHEVLPNLACRSEVKWSLTVSAAGADEGGVGGGKLLELVEYLSRRVNVHDRTAAR